MGSKKTEQKTDQQTTAKTELPAWMTQGGQQLYQQAAAGVKPYQSYTGQRVADLTANQQQASQIAQQQAGTWAPQMDEASALASKSAAAPAQTVTAAQFTPAAAQQYMNPYVANVQQNTLNQMRQQDAMDQQGLGDQIAASKAYGGARNGIMQMLQQKDQALARSNYLDSSNAAAYQNAQGQFNTDADRSLQGQTTNANLAETALSRGLTGADTLASLAAGRQQLGANDISLLGNTGAVEQATNQAKNDAAYEQFQNDQLGNLPVQERLMALLGGTPHDTTTTGTMNGTTTTKESGGFLKDLMGVVMAGAGAASGLGFQPFKASDRRLKRDVSLIRRMANGLGVYRYRYRWEPAGVAHVGAMADEVAVLVPAALGPVIGGFATVNYAKLREAF